MLKCIILDLSFAHPDCYDPCGLIMSGWRKMGELGGEGHEVNRPSPTENISKSAIKADSPRRLHLTALAVSKTRLYSSLHEIANLCRIKRITCSQWRAFRMVQPGDRRAAPTNTHNLLIINFIYNLLLLYFIFIYIFNFLCTGSVERFCTAAQVYNFCLPQPLLLDLGIISSSYAFI